MYEAGRILKKSEVENGVYLAIYIPNVNVSKMIDKNGEECGLWLNDNRHITVDQRKKIYATIADIADFTGYLPEEAKQVLKYKYMVDKGVEEFSLSNCELSLASDFIDYLLDFCFASNIPLTDLGINRTSNIDKYIYSAIKHKKCCVCGKPADLHHEDAIGMGNNRRKVDDSKKRKMPLCRICHTERHMIGEEAFSNKYHVYGIIYNEEEDELEENSSDMVDYTFVFN